MGKHKILKTIAICVGAMLTTVPVFAQHWDPVQAVDEGASLSDVMARFPLERPEFSLRPGKPYVGGPAMVVSGSVGNSFGRVFLHFCDGRLIAVHAPIDPQLVSELMRDIDDATAADGITTLIVKSEAKDILFEIGLSSERLWGVAYPRSHFDTLRTDETCLEKLGQ